MDPYISFVPWRREEWKGHATKKAVRMAIAYDRGRGQLRLFVLDHGPGGAVFHEIDSDDWSATFAD